LVPIDPDSDGFRTAEGCQPEGKTTPSPQEYPPCITLCGLRNWQKERPQRSIPCRSMLDHSGHKLPALDALFCSQ